jgi:hypothetical protein
MSRRFSGKALPAPKLVLAKNGGRITSCFLRLAVFDG